MTYSLSTSLITILQSERKIQNDVFNMAVIFVEIQLLLFKLHRNEYKSVFEVADYDSEVKNEKFIMAESTWWQFLTKYDIFLFKLHKNKYERVFKVADYD